LPSFKLCIIIVVYSIVEYSQTLVQGVSTMMPRRWFYVLTVCLIMFLCFLVPYTTHAATTLTPNPSSWTNGTANAGQYAQYNFYKYNKHHYSICINVTSGNADLYGSKDGYPTTTKYGKRSKNTGLDQDCIQFHADADSNYYLSVYGNGSTSKFSIYVIKDKRTQVPDYMKDQLQCPLDAPGDVGYCGDTYSDNYSHIAAPWGWDAAVSTPFYPHDEHWFHTGVDWYADPYDDVYAAYSGYIVRLGGLGSDYQGNDFCDYIVIEHDINGNKFMTAYLHIYNNPWDTHSNWEGEWVDRGEYIGEICNMSLAEGEPDHLHFAIKQGAYIGASGSSHGTDVWSGAMYYNAWKDNAPLFINPGTGSNPGLYFAY